VEVRCWVEVWAERREEWHGSERGDGGEGGRGGREGTGRELAAGLG